MGRPEKRSNNSNSWLLPREHGAYAALGFPLLTVLIHGRGTAAAWLIAAATCALFVGHESLVVMLGGRGRRMRPQRGHRARAQLLVLSTAALLSTAVALWMTPTADLLAALVVGVVPGALALANLLKKRERTLAGELVAGLGMSSTAIPVAVAGGIEMGLAIALAVLWWAVFVLGTLSVRSVTRRRLPEGRMLAWLTPLIAVCLLGICSGAALAAVAPWWPARALTPAAAGALGLALLGAAPSQLRRIGWGLVAVSVLTFVLLLPQITVL